MNHITLSKPAMLSGVCGLLALAAALPAAATDYTVTTFHYADDATLPTYAFDQNASGTIAGYYYDANYASHAFLRTSDGSYTEIDPTLDGEDNESNTFAMSVNDSGLVAGYTTIGGWPQGWIYNPSTGGTEAVSVPGAKSTWVQKINNDGTVVGSAFIYYGKTKTSYTTVAFTYSGRRFTIIRYPDMPYTFGYAINNEDQIAGYYTDSSGHNYAYTKSLTSGVYTSLDLYSSSGGAPAYGMNDNGDLTGAHGNASGSYVGFTYSADTGVSTEFTVSGAGSTVPFSIKNDGTLIGWASVYNTSTATYVPAAFVATPAQ